ncbi:MAG: LamG-like jellyroll fold domain-containing protein [Polyangiales bacterium]
MRRLLLLPVASLLALSIGCSGGSAPPVNPPDPTRNDVVVDGTSDATSNDVTSDAQNPADTAGDTTPADTQPGDVTAPTDTPPADVVTDTAPIDSPAVDAPPADVPVVDTAPIDTPPTDVPVVDTAPIDTPPVDVPVVDVPAMDVTSPDVPAMDVATSDVMSVDLPVIADTGTADVASDAGPFRCRSSADCVGNPAGGLCDIVSGECRMGCTPAGGCSPTQACCGGTCTDTQSDPRNCGSCGNVCSAVNGVAGCRAGVCVVDRCTAPFANCDGLATNGCEVDTTSNDAHCGACGMACTGGSGGAGRCTAGVCGIACGMGFGDCDRMASNGCETDVTSNAMNCGRCGVVCSATHASSRCLAGACFVDRCDMGFGDCDRDPATGCEADLQTSDLNCGACGRTCDATMGLGCSRGTCIPVASLVAWYPLDGSGADRVTGGPTATNTGATPTADRFGTAGAAMAFSPSAMSRLQVDNTRLPVGRAARTLSLWMRTMTRYMPDAGAMANWGTTAMSQRFGLIVLPDTLYFVGESDDTPGLRPVAEGRWHHVAVTYDGTTVVTYVDGVLEAMGAKTLNTVGTQLLIGRSILDHYPGRPVPEYFDGAIDEVRVYSRALDAASVNALYQEGGYRPM